MLKNYLLVFFISMVPIVELRGAIPIGLGLGLPALPTYFLCVLGNMLPVPFIYLFARKFLIWGYHKPLIGPICRFCINKGEKGGRALEAKAGRGLTVALLLFVGIPLPGTGAWTGTLAGSILDPDHLGHRDPGGLDVPDQFFVLAGACQQDPVHQAVPQPAEAVFFHLRVIFRAAQQRSVSLVTGRLLDGLGHGGEHCQVESGNHHSDGVAFALAQTFGQQVGPVAELFHGSHDPGFGFRVDTGIVVQGPGDCAYVHTGQPGHVFQGWHGFPSFPDGPFRTASGFFLFPLIFENVCR